VSNRSWPDGDDPIAAEVRRALDEALARWTDASDALEAE